MTKNNKLVRIRFGVAIVLICLIATIGVSAIFARSDRTYAMTSTAMGVQVDELLSRHYQMRSDGKAFNRASLNALLAALGGANVTAVDALGTQTAADLRTRNGLKDIVVQFGGFQWTVTHVTKDNHNNLIATLWLASSTETCQWNYGHSNFATYDYPSSMYSTSYIRANALNSGGCGYVANAADGPTGVLTPLAQSDQHPYAAFTMQTVPDPTDAARNMSVRQYLVQPKDVAYQQTETILSETGVNNGWYTCPNEAYGTPAIESYYQGNTVWDFSKKNHYADWADDYLWLPSIAETGYDTTVRGIWDLSCDQRSNSTGSWLRSGYYPDAYSACFLDQSGNSNGYGLMSLYAVRPALHLNLTKASAESADPIDVSTTDKSKIYDGTAQPFALSGFDASEITITSVSGKGVLGNAIAANDISIDATNGIISAKHAGTYTVELDLTVPNASFWTSGDDSNGKRVLTFSIVPKQLSVALTQDVPSGLWDWALNDPYTATLTVSGIASGDAIGLKAIYLASAGGAQQEIAATQTGTQAVAQIDLSQIPIGKYTLTAALDNGVGESANYSISDGLTNANLPMPFTVRAKTADLSGAGWLHTAQDTDGNPIAGQPNAQPIADGAQLDYALYGTLHDHAAILHNMRLDTAALPKDGSGNPIVAIDALTTSYNGTTYADGYSNAIGSSVNRYISKVLLKIVHEDYLFANNRKQIELSLSWEIVKGTFDLSGVQWEYLLDNGVRGDYLANTELEYNDNKLIRVSVKESSLPLGLTVNGGLTYVGNANVQYAVGNYTATVDTGLDYDTASFHAPGILQLIWKIVGKNIQTKWKSKVHNAYFILELNIDAAYAGMVHYRYYDASNNLLGADAAGLAAMDQMIATQGIGPNNPQDFTIEAYLDGANSGNYRLVGDLRKVVRVGIPLTMIDVHMPAQTTYDGDAHYTGTELTFTGANIQASDYTITYYAGTDLTNVNNNVKLNDAPKDAGKYVIAIEMHGTSFLLSQGVFGVEILPKQVAVPTVKDATFNGTEYSLLDLLAVFDAALMTLDLVTTATNAGTYHATVTLPNSNYVWATADGATGSQEYALEWSISKVKLSEIWGTDSSGKPTLSVSSKYADYVQIVYEYYDADGNLVAESDLVAGQSYQVVAKLSASSAANFELADINGDVSQTPSESAPKQFTYGYDPNNPNGSGGGLGGISDADLKWFKIVFAVIAGTLFAMLFVQVLMWITMEAIRRLRKRKTE